LRLWMNHYSLTRNLEML